MFIFLLSYLGLIYYVYTLIQYVFKYLFSYGLAVIIYKFIYFPMHVFIN